MTSRREPRSVRFRREREQHWRDLEAITDGALRRGLRRIDPAELERLPALYRSALSSLSVARETALDRNLIAYLESLCARTHLVLYGMRPGSSGAVARFFTEDFPRRVRSMLPELGLSTALFALGVAAAYALVRIDTDWFYAFMDAAMAGGRDPSAPTEVLRRSIYDAPTDGLAHFAAFLFTHNARIALLAFALGFAAGVPTALLLFMNGLSLGAFVALHDQRGLLIPLLGWLLPHGVPEIGAVILCGAAGLHVGRSVVLPGQRSVADAVTRAGRRAALVALGCVLLLAYAGLVEGIFRQVVRDDAPRFLLAAFNALWLTAWLFVAGRASRRTRTASREGAT